DLVQRDVGVVADPAFRRPARDVVRDAVAEEDVDRAVVHGDGDRDLDTLLALREDADEVRIDCEDLSHASELRLRQLERVLPQVRGRLSGGHRHAPPRSTARGYSSNPS